MKRSIMLMLICASPLAHALTVQDFATGRPQDAAQVHFGFPQAILSNWLVPAAAVTAVQNMTPYTAYVLYSEFGSTASVSQWDTLDSEMEKAGGYLLMREFYDKVSEGEAGGAAAAYAARIKAWPNPSIYMSLEDIYLEFATATSTTITAGEAVMYASIYAGGYVVGAFTGGYTAGTMLDNLMEEYDPSFNADLWEDFLDLLDAQDNLFDDSTAMIELGNDATFDCTSDGEGVPI